MDPYHNYNHLAHDAFLWVYNSETGVLRKYRNVDIFQTLEKFTNRTLDKTFAINKLQRLDRIVSSREKAVHYYSGYREYLIWSTKDEENVIKSIILNSIKQKTNYSIDSIIDDLAFDHSIIKLALNNLYENASITEVSRDEIEQTVNKWFYISDEGE